MNEAKIEKQQKSRQMIVNGKMISAIVAVILPLILYNFGNYLYNVYDTIIVSTHNLGNVENIVIIGQIRDMISTFGIAYTIGGAIVLARMYGAGVYEDAKKAANSFYFTSVIFMLLILFFFIPLGIPFLRFLATPEEVINSSINYYYLQILIVATTLMNSTFIAIEKSKGNTQKLIFLNLIVVVVKIGLTTLFVDSGLFPHADLSFLALATLIANLCIFVFSLFVLFNHNNVMQISFKSLDKFSFAIVRPILQISLPIFFGRFLFSLGKVYINAQLGLFYGAEVIGILGVSNTISSLVINVLSSIEEGTITIISQNVGNNKEARATKFYKLLLTISVVFSLIGTIAIAIFIQPISQFFAPGDLRRQEMIQAVYFFEQFSIVFSGIESVSSGLLNGYGRTKLPMIVLISRIFIFRIPSLLLFYHVFHVNYSTAGIMLFVSNIASGILALVIAIIFIKNRKSKGLILDR